MRLIISMRTSGAGEGGLNLIGFPAEERNPFEYNRLHLDRQTAGLVAQ
jgi:hypothetical protein